MMKKEGSKANPFSGYAVQFGLATQEAPALIDSGRQKLFIGIPCEQSDMERRIPLTPESVRTLVNNGHRICVETKAGAGAKFEDKDYSEAGAEIAYDSKKVYEAHIIVKILPPSLEEIELMKPGQIIISAMQLSLINDGYLQKLMEKKVTALALEYIQDEQGILPFVRSMSEIAGSAVMPIAAEFLSNFRNGPGILLGGISGVPPAKVVIIGAGIVGEFAARTAIGLGANVKVFDTSTYKLMRLQNDLHQRVFTSNIYPEVLQRELSNADVAVGAMHSKSGRSPVLVTEEMVSHMPAGSLIVDVSIDQGGIFETSEVTSHQNPTFKKLGVIHYCVPNIASRFSRTSSYAVSNVLTSSLLDASEHGGFERKLEFDLNPRHGVYIYKGYLTNRYLSQRFNLKYTPIDLCFPGRQ